MVASLLLPAGISHAQNSTQDPMQINLPVPRRKVRRVAIQVSADPASKPIPPPPMLPPTPPPPTPSQLPPTEAEVKKKAERQQKREHEQVEDDRMHDKWVNIGKVAGFVLVVGVGIFAVTDIFRQVQRAKRRNMSDEDYEDDDPDF